MTRSDLGAATIILVQRSRASALPTPTPACDAGDSDHTQILAVVAVATSQGEYSPPGALALAKANVRWVRHLRDLGHTDQEIAWRLMRARERVLGDIDARRRMLTGSGAPRRAARSRSARRRATRAAVVRADADDGPPSSDGPSRALAALGVSAVVGRAGRGLAKAGSVSCSMTDVAARVCGGSVSALVAGWRAQ